ncbi:2-C-methyl-D-erythritol 4-phosphate cytidylyltransferase [Breznakia sp. PF5-3]|uniref:IspD/TarI family cytidylyltransferase n=1 Tax=unclassified Breznakia TaxID=2623764 RepID=UPI0024059BBE|nr:MULTISPECIES: IspD/TarI family cytidylyltransferase [unclassified Breznakia]MDF9824679.1 2-C-methyl-D-erythritol 4-phosphate cytidylyltransferase [Breznakia sp. PM6-1]MDF9835342.1 2-C-methyl-D-erythritol 4-phosphate cytidylyltransferase [Breznakia sp. PF5-3]MDF9836941.1 2-C-methyl-D-erythritol 4-phosphate cytidylyltransferase [Breznakia sp. PFB2-8]MDF9859577.1 2-C-methyl-D-erythritol 4-phosphate cytidylyltransferase [Breznakia sp. PH5-24]
MNIAVIFAGGVGARMGNIDRPKQFLEVDGIPVIIHTLLHFERCEKIDYISIACISEYISYLKELLEKYQIKKVRWISPGGDTGQLSIFNGVKAVYDDLEIDRNATILVHDAVRPMIDEELILNNIDNIEKNGNSVTVCGAIETIFMSKNNKDIDSILNRNNAYHAKAPQCFRLDELYNAHIDAIEKKDINNWDSCSLMFKNGVTLSFVLGKSSNIKITTMEDFYIFETMYHLNKKRK